MDYLSYLPEELLEGVCGYIPDRDGLDDLRLCCKRLYSKTQYASDIRHFSIVKCMFTPGSLQKLIDLARNERVRKVIQEVHVCFVNFDEISNLHPGGDICDRWRVELLDGVFSTRETEMLRNSLLEQQDKTTRKKIRRQQRRMYARHRHEQNRLRNTSADVELLAEALKNLPSLRTVHSASKFDCTDPPLGARQVFRDTGAWPHVGFCSRVGSIHSIYVIFGALLRSKVSIRSLGLWSLLGEIRRPVTNTPSSRRRQRKFVPRRTFTETQIVDVDLSQLKDLSFDMDGDFEHRLYVTIRTHPLSWLLLLAPRLPHLQHLSFDSDHTETSIKFLQILAFNEDIFPRLRSLRLVYVGFPNPEFRTLLKRLAPTLQHLEICKLFPRVPIQHLPWLPVLTGLPRMVSASCTFRRRLTIGSKEVYTETMKGDTPAEFQEILTKHMRDASEEDQTLAIRRV